MSNIICIRKFVNIAEAEVSKSFLQANGIEADLFSDSAGGIRPDMIFVSNIRLMVREEDKEKALELLDKSFPSTKR